MTLTCKAVKESSVVGREVTRNVFASRCPAVVWCLSVRHGHSRLILEKKNV